MTDLEDPDRCPRCGSHDQAVISVQQFTKGTRTVLACEQCAVNHQKFVVTT